jgi:hypothetical protein
MGKRVEDYIPQNVLAAAEKAGLSTPLWHVGGGANNPEHKRQKTFEDIVAEVEADQAVERVMREKALGEVTTSSEIQFKNINEQE